MADGGEGREPRGKASQDLSPAADPDLWSLTASQVSVLFPQVQTERVPFAVARLKNWCQLQFGAECVELLDAPISRSANFGSALNSQRTLCFLVSWRRRSWSRATYFTLRFVPPFQVLTLQLRNSGLGLHFSQSSQFYPLNPHNRRGRLRLLRGLCR